MELFETRRSSRPLYALLLLLAFFTIVMLVLSACGTSQPGQVTPTPTLTVTATLPPTPTSTPEPLGGAEQPLVIGLVSETGDPQIAAAASELARQVSQISKLNVQGSVYPSYQALLFEINEGNAHIAWMPPLTYIYASKRELVEVGLLTNHFGVYQYGTQFMANVESKFVPYYDPISGLSSATADVALRQFKGFRPCWVEPQSPTGYILPAGQLLLRGLNTLPPVITQSHTAVVRALYVKGICDFGATYSISGDPRTASVVQQDLPDVMNRVPIIWRSDAVIPNISLAYSRRMGEGERQAINEAFLQIVKIPEGRALLSLSAGNSATTSYQIDDLKPIKDSTYDPLRLAILALGLDLTEMIGK